MKGKSLAVSIISAAILAIGAYAGLFTESAQAWLGIVSMALILVLNQFFPSGTPVTGWNWVIWTTNIAAIVIQLLNATMEEGLLKPELVNGIIIAINIFIQTFLKDYNGGNSIAEKKLV